MYCPLAGRHQVVNAATAAAALTAIEHSAGRYRTSAIGPAGLRSCHARPTSFLMARTIPAGARALAQHIRDFYSDTARLADLWSDAR